MTELDRVLVDVEDQIATLTLNRPEKLNALDYATIDALLIHLDRLEDVAGVRALILTGAGNRAFSAGGDIPEFTESIQGSTPRAVRDFVRRGQTMTARIEAYGKPIIAAVNGLAYGGGCEIAEACHLGVAQVSARFAKPEVKIGIPPTFGGTQRLPRLAGRKRALEYLLTGDPFSADAALAMGIVNAIVPEERLMDAARALAGRVVRHSQEVVRAILTAVTRGLNGSISEGLAMESEQFARVAQTPDTLEALERWHKRH